MTAPSAAAALELLSARRFDVLLSDIGMPRQDGYELIRAVRQHAAPQVRSIRAAALTAYARTEDHARAISAGYQLHLTKPVDPTNLVEVVSSLAKQGNSCGPDARAGHAACTLARALTLRSALLGLFLGVAATTFVELAAAQTTTSIDTARGPLTGSTRRIGLGGAFVALADDTAGVAINPASVALRLPYSWTWWDYGFGVDFSVGAWLPKNDLYNQGTAGDAGKSSALFGSLAAVLYAGHFGLGAAAEAQSNAASRPQREQGVGQNLSANFGMVHSSAAYGFIDNQLLLGVGARFVGMSFDTSGSGGPLSTAGAGYTAGVTYKPAAEQYRVALAYKSGIAAEVPGAAGEAPSRVEVPWELALGFTYQFGRRVMNPRFVSVDEVVRGATGGAEPTKADRERAERQLFEDYQGRQRRYVLLTSELSVVQGDADHVGVERLWTTRGTASAARPVLLPRVGVEAEVVPHVLRLRAGSYYEPERVGLQPVRIHGTGGLDVRLFRWNVFGLVKPFDFWQLSLAADAARAYLNTSFSIGFWH